MSKQLKNAINTDTNASFTSPVGDRKVNPFKDLITGGFGGMCLVIIGHPPDTVKVLLQTMPEPKAGEKPLYKDAFDCMKKTIKKEGFFALYRGVGSMLIGVTPTSALSFFGNSVGKWLQKPSNKNGEYSVFQLFLAGSLAGITNTIVLTPVERVKCVLQFQEMAAKSNKTKIPNKYNGSWDCARQLYRENGIRSLYLGAGITTVRGIPTWGVYFSMYESIKRLLRPKKESANKLSAWKTILAGGTAGMFSWLVAMPADVLKSRLQSAPIDKYPNGARDVFQEIKRKEGLGSLYKGTTAVLIRAFPANAACFLGYEIAMKLLDSMI